MGRPTINRAARAVLTAIEAGGYEGPSGAFVEIGEAVTRSVSGVVLYEPGDLETLRLGARLGASLLTHTEAAPEESATPVVELMDATTQQALAEVSRREGAGHVALLNFASARNPGGGFLGGAKAQEEDLCRCSALYPTLLEAPTYYEANRQQRSLLYTDHAIFSPGVPFFRVKSEGPLLEPPLLASVITMPAPNSGPFLQRGGAVHELEKAFARRWRAVLTIALAHGVDTLILGA